MTVRCFMATAKGSRGKALAIQGCAGKIGGMGQVTLFISCVSNEFRSYRDALRKALESHKVTVHIQDGFAPGGKPTLDKLDRYIRESDAVIHLVGDMTGAMAKQASVDMVSRLCPEIATRIPEIAAAFDGGGLILSFTQWEAYLAIYHDKELLIAKPTETAAREPATFVSEKPQRDAQTAHLARLEQRDQYAEITFVDYRDIAIGVSRALHDLLSRAGIRRREGAAAPKRRYRRAPPP